ncbi:MAG: DUF134 domain-containing protein [Anaerovoracaceae bacterium]
MPRPRKCRRVCEYPRCTSFAPEDGAGGGYLVLSLDEYETIRLLDLEGCTQSECAERMNVARTTVTDIYSRARRKIADCIVNGRNLVIAGGDYDLERKNLGGKNAPGRKGETAMRIAVTYDNGNIFQHFGRTERFKLYDIENGRVKEAGILESGEAGHGALAGLLKESDVDALICGGLGGGAKTALGEEGIKVYAGVSGSADEAAERLAAGTLEYVEDANCDHHGHGSGEGCGHGHGHGCGH